MNVRTLGRLASASAVTGVSVLALAAPAQAQQSPYPPGLDDQQGQTVDNGTDWTTIAGGIAGGVAVVGAGTAAVIVLRRHHHPHVPHAQLPDGRTERLRRRHRHAGFAVG